MSKKNKTKDQKISPKDKKPSVIWLFVALLLFVLMSLFGVVMIKGSVDEISYKKACTVETTGTVGEVSVKSKKTRDSKGRQHTSYTYTATYTYEIDGESINDTLVSSNKLKDGQTVKVRYDPDDPAHKYVKGHEQAGSVGMFILGIVWVGIFLVIIYAIIRAIIHKLFKKKTDVTDKDNV
ncbi:DUF3592 domain-containing protein [Ruminococcus albus]|uniref:DUF3592 domain-containing protein n=1 Tax=Ruminococcus albus TaxID=1264 RepID=A0A1H7KV98_RUMAL|nr:DUF3592 domain-containing protein [Ruminococcus albus]SEK90783.1 Protein of unknown function [Ruminococcus albus]